jgi:signal peptidase I
MPEFTAPKKTTQTEANYKETVESILVAFILAFIFRAFVVEAFVIPTGSMAPTLYGAHIRYRCPDCGYVFDAGFKGTANAADDDVDIPSNGTPATSYHCPNCGYQFTTDPQPVRFGDRILVLKYLYLFQQPRRWDVVVFKSPDEQRNHVAEDPEYATNYIKRLIAIGPESVVLLDGDVYIGPPNAEQPLGPDGKPLFKIQRKPNYAQDALWRTVYNNDFIPHLGEGEHPWKEPWTEETPSSGWKLSGPATSKWRGGAPSRVFDFSNSKGGGAIAFDPEADPDTHALSDFLVYDEWEHNTQGWQPIYVNDLKLSCFYTRKSGDGPLRLQLSRNDDLFTAEIKGGKVSLLMAKRVSVDRPDAVTGEHPVGRSAEPVAVDELNGSEPVQVEMVNVDYRVSIRINGKEIIATTDEQYAPNVKALWDHEEEQFRQRQVVQNPFARPLVQIDARNQSARIEHLVLSRDVYYLSLSHPAGFEFWATTRKITHLKKGEYFVMGDNSFISGDARYWQDPIDLPREGLDVEAGRVPEQFMLGKAFFVYWPAGYRLPYLGVNGVPDFGEMRFIR